jgi:hypothetical protein
MRIFSGKHFVAIRVQFHDPVGIALRAESRKKDPAELPLPIGRVISRLPRQLLAMETERTCPKPNDSLG